MRCLIYKVTKLHFLSINIAQAIRLNPKVWVILVFAFSVLFFACLPYLFCLPTACGEGVMHCMACIVGHS